MKTRAYLPLLAAIVLSGCGTGENSNLKAELSELTKDVKGRVPPIPEIKPYDPYPYAATSLPDPFKPALVKALTSDSPSAYDSEVRRLKEPLEAYPLESMKMVGTLARTSEGVTALIKSDAGLSKVVIGNYLGQNFGKVLTISANKIELRELFQDSAGEWSERIAVLELAAKEEKK